MHRSRPPLPAALTRLALLAVVAAMAAVLVGILASPPRPSGPGAGDQAAALAVLHHWDTRRAAAWAHGSREHLAELYLPGSAAGRADVRLLGRYRSRGYVVRGLRTQVLALEVLGHAPDRWTVRVTDRLVSAAAVRSSRWRWLPRDASSRRVLTLSRGSDGRWRVGRVRDVATPAPR